MKLSHLSSYLLNEAAKRRVAGLTPEEAVTDPRKSYLYAHDVLHGRFPEGEHVIATDPEWSYFYAREVLDHNRFKQGEAVIMKHPMYAFYYARDILGGRWPDAEKAIFSDTKWGEYYQRFVNHNRE